MPHVEELSIEKFIEKFNQYEQCDVLRNTFTRGFCYYFALILKARFPEGEIYYHDIKNHYVYKLHDQLYDITGNCTDEYNDNTLMRWSDVELYDPLLYDKLIRDCVLKNNIIYP